jgi:hypothetical protein
VPPNAPPPMPTATLPANRPRRFVARRPPSPGP